MRLRGTTIGALNLFQADRGGMGSEELAAARAFADVATIAILQHQATIDALVVNDRLNQALNSRIIIEQAKGMLAERANIDVNTAFDRLRHHARNHNLKPGGGRAKVSSTVTSLWDNSIHSAAPDRWIGVHRRSPP